MSESNLHEIETPIVEENRVGIIKLKQELKIHLHNRNLSNPSELCSPSIVKPANCGPKTKAASRLVFNNKPALSRVSVAANPIERYRIWQSEDDVF